MRLPRLCDSGESIGLFIARPILAMVAIWSCQFASGYPEFDESEIDFLNNPNPDYFVKKGYLVNYDDYNFDGLLDFQVLVFPHGLFSLYYYYLWDPQEKKYKEDATLSSLGNVVIDKKEKKIYSIEKGGHGNCEYKFNIYKVQDNSYKLIETQTQKYDKESKLYIRMHNLLDENGDTTTMIENIPPGSCRPNF